MIAGSPSVRWKKLSYAFGAAVAVGFAAWHFLGSDQAWQDYRHEHQLRRITRHVKPILLAMPHGEAMERLPKAERGRNEIIRAIWTALPNWPLHYRRNTTPEKVRAIADRLDATNGADLQTFEGCVQLLALFEAASPSFREYPWVVTVYEMEAEGTIPRLSGKK